MHFNPLSTSLSTFYSPPVVQHINIYAQVLDAWWLLFSPFQMRFVTPFRTKVHALAHITYIVTVVRGVDPCCFYNLHTSMNFKASIKALIRHFYKKKLTNHYFALLTSPFRLVVGWCNCEGCFIKCRH